MHIDIEVARQLLQQMQGQFDKLELKIWMRIQLLSPFVGIIEENF